MLPHEVKTYPGHRSLLSPSSRWVPCSWGQLASFLGVLEEHQSTETPLLGPAGQSVAWSLASSSARWAVSSLNVCQVGAVHLWGGGDIGEGVVNATSLCLFFFFGWHPHLRSFRKCRSLLPLRSRTCQPPACPAPLQLRQGTVCDACTAISVPAWSLPCKLGLQRNQE